MSIPTPEPEDINLDPNLDEGFIETTQVASIVADEMKRRFLLITLIGLVMVCIITGVVIARYIAKPQPIPDLLPVVSQPINNPPSYKLSFALSAPVGVAVSPDDQRIYATESDEDRLVKMFDRDGNFITSFAPPFTTKANRTLTYVATDPIGRVYVADTYNDVIGIYDADGKFLDGIFFKNLTLSKFVAEKIGHTPPLGTIIYFDGITQVVVYQIPGGTTQRVPSPDRSGWSIVGVRFDPAGNMLVTNTTAGKHEVIVYQAKDLQGSLVEFNPQIKEFGAEGKGNGQLSFPNTAVVDSRGNYYVSDGNNGRISLWSADQQYKTFFGFGSSVDALNLPRGMWMDKKDRLHVADAVGGVVRVYDVSAEEPAFLFSIGVYGTAEGEFNFPNDVFIDGTGRLYVADRQNNRIQVWSY